MARDVSPEDLAKWEAAGGYVRPDAKGRPVFVIRRMMGGQRFEKSTRRHTFAAAMIERDKFDRDPHGYNKTGGGPRPTLLLTNDLCKAFLRWSRVEKQNSDQWVRTQQRLLAWWMEQLRGVDLRRATLADHIRPALASPKLKGKPQRIEVLKTLYGWLRKVTNTVTAHEDPTFGTLPAGTPRAAQDRKSKVIPREHYLLAREHLVGVFRDALDVLAGTGWHMTEVVRFADEGTIEPLPKSMQVSHGAVGVLVCPMHKSGAPHRTAVSIEVLDAAKRLRAHRWPFDSTLPFYKTLASACAAVPVTNPDGTTGIPTITPGRFRHSVATWAFEAGADPAAVSAFLGHKSPATTKKFYATLATVPKIPTLA